MKKLLPLLLILFIVSCKKQTGEENLAPSDLTLTYGTKFDKLLLGVESPNSQLNLTGDLKLESQGITLPIGTIIQKVQGDPSAFTYSLPNGYKVVGQNTNGKAGVAAGGSITCTCTEGKGCSPYVASLGKNQSIGCAMSGNCTKCTQVLSGARIGTPDETISNAEIVNFNQEIHFITTKEELSSTVSPSHTLMQLDEIRQQIVAFAKGYQINDLESLNKSTGPSDLPSTYTYVHVNVYGRAILLPVQSNLVNAANPLFNEILRGAISANGRMAAPSTVYKCKCNSGSAGCSLNNGSLLFAKAVWCEAGSCGSCTLSWL